MKLAGYIKAYKEFIFTIPVYTDDKEYFYHNVDENYRIIEFNKTAPSENLIPFKNSLKFEKNYHGAIVFVGKNNDLIIDNFEDGIKKTKHYLESKTQKNEFLNVKEDLLYFEAFIVERKKFSNHKVAEQNNNRISWVEIQYVVKFLNPNNKLIPINNYRHIITSAYDKVANSENKEKAIIEFRNEITKLSTPVFNVQINRNLNPYKKIKLNKSIRKTLVPKKLYLKKSNIEAKVILIKEIIEKIEEKQKENPMKVNR